MKRAKERRALVLEGKLHHSQLNAPPSILFSIFKYEKINPFRKYFVNEKLFDRNKLKIKSNHQHHQCNNNRIKINYMI